MTKFLFVFLALLTASTLFPTSSKADIGDKYPKVAIERSGKVTTVYLSGEHDWHAVIEHMLGWRQFPEQKLSRKQSIARRSISPYRIELVRHFCANNPERAMREYLIMVAMILYDAKRCVDKTAMAGIKPSLVALAAPECQGMQGKLSNQVRRKVTNSLIDDPEFKQPDTSPWWICSYGMDAVNAGLQKKPLKRVDWLVPEDEWTGIWEEVTNDLRNSTR